MILSILTATTNNFTRRDGTLPVLVAALQRQTVPPDTELVVVDGGTEPETTAYVEKIRDDPTIGFDVRLVSTDSGENYAKLWNRAVEHATGDLLLCLDCDTVPLGSDAIERTVDTWEPGRFLCGAQQYWTPPNWDASNLEKRIKEGDASDLQAWGHLPTDAIDRDAGTFSLQEYTLISNYGLISRSDLEAVGRFDQTAADWPASDRSLITRLLAENIAFVNLHNQVSVLHMNHPSRSLRGRPGEGGVALPEIGVNPAVDLPRLFRADADEVTNVFSTSPKHDDSSAVLVRQPGDPEATDDDITDRSRADGSENSVTADMDVSVIVPTFNAFDDRNGSIELLLTVLEGQRNANFEVIVVDDGSTDRTPAFLADYVDETPLDMSVVKFDENTGNRALARNRGAECAANELFMFIDDDTIPLSDTALARTAAAGEPGRFLCGARRYWSDLGWDQDLFTSLIESRSYEDLKDQCVYPRGVNWRHGYRKLFEYTFVGNFGAVHREDFWEVSGFDDDFLSGYDHEDVDLMYRLYLDGCSFICLHDELSVAHLNHPIKTSDSESRTDSVDRFREREQKQGYAFKVNHLFGVYENDGEAILEPIDPDGSHSYQ